MSKEIKASPVSFNINFTYYRNKNKKNNLKFCIHTIIYKTVCLHVLIQINFFNDKKKVTLCLKRKIENITGDIISPGKYSWG